MNADEKAKWVADASLFMEMLRTSGWDRFVGYLSKEENDCYEAWLGNPSNNSDYCRGYIAGLRKSANIPVKIIDTMKERP